MYLKSFVKSAVILLFVTFIASCGSEGNSNSNGTLTLTVTPKVLGGGVVNYTATAAFSGQVPGVKINFGGKHYKKDGTVIAQFPSEERATDSTGTAEKQFNVAQDTLETTYLEITASTGGLFKSDTETVEKFVP
jgi:hypothetical protein